MGIFPSSQFSPPNSPSSFWEVKEEDEEEDEETKAEKSLSPTFLDFEEMGFVISPLGIGILLLVTAPFHDSPYNSRKNEQTKV